MSMDPPPPPAASGNAGDAPMPSPARSGSFSAKSDDSQTAAEFLRDQMQLEQDAREALPFSIENCTKILGPLRQAVFACLTCNPPPEKPTDPYKSAGVCYACSIQCHGEHTLVEIFTKRNFTCDCGTTRFPATNPCTLRVNPDTNTRGGVHSEEPSANNKYNQNFRNRFCACALDYDPFQQKGTMFQCLGLGTHETGGCGEDWYHPGCLVSLGPKWFEGIGNGKKAANGSTNEPLPTISEDAQTQPQADTSAIEDEEEDEDLPLPPGFPPEEDFETFICYKCVDAYPWIKRYAGTAGFLPALFLKPDESNQKAADETASTSKKRKAEDDVEMDLGGLKRARSEGTESLVQQENGAAEQSAGEVKAEDSSSCKYAKLPPAPEGQFSLFMKEDFRSHLCRCSSCYPNLNPHPQLLEEEEVYEPPISEDGSENGGSTHGSGSLYERGESALRNVDRVRAIEGVMAYNHLKDQLKPFFQQFADSGKAIGADDIKAYFAKLRGDDQAIKDAGQAAASSSKGGENGDGDGKDGDARREQSGY